MDTIFRVASEIATPMSLAALSIIVLSTILTVALKKTGRGNNQRTVEKISFYAFIVGIVLGVGGLAAYSATTIIPMMLNQNFRVAGVVIDAETGEPISFANVNLVGGSSTETNSNGVFEIVVPRSWVPSLYEILVHENDYEPGVATAESDKASYVVVRLRKIPKKEAVFAGFDRIAASHYLGLPVLHLQYKMKNENSSSIYVNEVSVDLEKRGGRRFSLNPVSTLSVTPNDAWTANGIRIRPKQTVTVTSEYAFQDAPLADISAKINFQMPRTPPTPPIHDPIFDEGLISQINSFVNKNFGWSDGEWMIKISMYSTSGETVSNIDFSVDMDDLDILREIVKDYPYGYGIIQHLRFTGPNKGYFDVLAKRVEAR